MRLVLAVALAMLSGSAFADDFPKFPKAGPPDSLPEAPCDSLAANAGEWLVGRWVAPQTRMEFVRQDGRLTWAMDRKGSVADDFGWTEGGRIEGTVDQVSACTLALSAGGGAFRFDGVLSESGKIYGVATGRQGRTLRLVLRRER